MNIIGQDVELVLHAAGVIAKNMRHEYVTLEHLLLAMLSDKSASDIISKCGGDIILIKRGLEEFLYKHNTYISDENHTPNPTISIKRIINRALNHIQNCGRNGAVVISDILIALYEERDSFSVYLLEKSGITRYEIMNYIAHGIPKEADAGFSSSYNNLSEDPLNAFTVNLLKKAAAGKIDNVIGRDKEITLTIRTLCRRRKNNPLYVGDPGVGKTALAEGLALHIHNGNVPDILKNTAIYSLDMGLILAGTKYRGDFEGRMKGIINQLKGKSNAILFVDEIHTLIGGGAVSGGALDASNLLKPYLASGDIKCIGSTTHSEYRNYIEKDRALARRFHKIDVDEPTINESIKIISGLKGYYETHHDIKISKSAIKASVLLSARYINDRKLPDKAIDVIDEAGASIRMLNTNKKKKIINVNIIEKIISDMARIPIKNLTSAEKDYIKTLDQKLKKVVFGQDNAIDSLARVIKLSKAGLSNKEKPIGSFLFAGPTGVGKTEIAKQLAGIMNIKFLRFDMSEYSEKHSVARLIGAPPGYIGFEQGGLLTDAVNKNPYSVLLLDEIEKAHPDMFNILLQVMDHASLTDNTGKRADFRNIILIMTSNAGAAEMEKGSIGFNPDNNFKDGDINKALKDIFIPEFRNRLDTIIYFKQLSSDVMEKIVDKFIAEIADELKKKRISIELTKTGRTWLAIHGYNPQYGARPMSRLIQTEIKEKLSDEILFGALKNGGKVILDEKNGKIAITVTCN